MNPMTHKGTVTLETNRLILRRLTIDDADAMFKNWASDHEVAKFLTWHAHTDVSVSELIINSWLPLYDKPDYYHWTIVLKESMEPVGTIAAVSQQEDINMVHIGYCIGQNWWNKGITSEAFKEIIPFFFEEVGVNRIESRHDPQNPNSGKVMIKCGLQYEGTKRQGDVNNQGICDAAYYALLAKDYFAMKERKGWDVRVYPLNYLLGCRFTVIFARYKDKWLYCRSKERDTYETAGGHIEKGETPLEAAKREFYEETGAVKFDIKPIFDYAVYKEDEFSNGRVFFAQVHELGEMPDFEMAEVKLFDTTPDEMRFPQILPVLFKKVESIGL